MKPTYLSGDIIYIKAQPDVAEGAVAVVLIDDTATLKHIYRTPHGVTLVSDNPAYPPMYYNPSEDQPIRILGIPVGYTRMYAHTAPIVTKGMPK
jgi:repressor LexA